MGLFNRKTTKISTNKNPNKSSKNLSGTTKINYEKRRDEALKLNQKVKEITKKQEENINRYEKITKTKEYQQNQQRRKSCDNAFVKMDEKYSQKEHEAYSRYYNHIHNDFDVENSKVRYTNKKYKDGFMDENYIKDLYDSKIKK